ncbi:MAG: hypothetical protein AAF791_04500 [Bacteroidota bacterium]
MSRLHPLTASIRWLWREHATPIILIAAVVLVFGLGYGLRACTEADAPPPHQVEIQSTRDRTDSTAARLRDDLSDTDRALSGAETALDSAGRVLSEPVDTPSIESDADALRTIRD